MAHPDLRASDDDRQRVVAELGRHAADGRLTLAEFHDRAGQAYAAATYGELAAVTRDLPALPAPAAPARVSRSLIGALAGALVIVAALGVLLALFK